MQSIIIGDEAGFALNGEINSHNVREYAPKGNPPAFNFERTNSRAKLTIWAALCGNGVILGPYIFYGNMNGLAYLRMLNEFAFPQLAIHFNNQFGEGLFRGLWWAQDGAPAHRLIEVRDRLNEVFGENRVIALQHNVEWPWPLKKCVNLTHLFVQILTHLKLGFKTHLKVCLINTP